MIVWWLLLTAGAALSFGGVMFGVQCVFCKNVPAIRRCLLVFLVGWWIVLLSARVIDGNWLGGIGVLVSVTTTIGGIVIGTALLGCIRSKNGGTR